MRILFLLALLQEPAAPVVEPWTKSLAEGLAEVKRLSETDKTAEALALTERLLAPTPSAKWREDATAHPGWKRTVVEAAGPLLGAFGVASLSDAERATIYHARGVLLSTSGLAGVDEFERARSLAGPGDLRLDATYDAGWTWLAEGETQRAKIPEIAGTAPQPAAPAGPPGAEPPAPDPLALARTAYMQARDRFVDRLKLESSDADSRANLELTQRRLKELAEIEKKREEKKKQEQKDQQKKDEKDQNKDEKQKDDQKKDEEKKPDEQPKPDEKKPDEKPPEDPKKDEQKPDEKKDPKKDEPKPSKEDQQLTREEVMRLLDILKSREEEGKKLQEQLRASQRVRVKKDW